MPSNLVIPSSHTAVIVCEGEPYWTPELQRQFHGAEIIVRGCRRWSELTNLSREFARAVTVVDLDHSPAECLTGLAQRCADAHRSAVILLSSPRYRDLEGVLREAGVGAFFLQMPTGKELARCCRRWLESVGPRIVF